METLRAPECQAQVFVESIRPPESALAALCYDQILARSSLTLWLPLNPKCIDKIRHRAEDAPALI